MRLSLFQVVNEDMRPLLLLIVNHRVAVRERAALDVLSAQPHAVSLEQKRANGEALRGRPIDADALGEGLRALLQDTLNTTVHFESLRERDELVHHVGKDRRRDAVAVAFGGDAAALLRRLVNPGLGPL